MVDPEIAAAAREREKQERRERKERRRREREARREARQRERERKRLILLQQQLQQQQQLANEEGEGPSSDAEDEVLFREAMSEVPVVGSPVPEYEVEEEEEEEDEEEARMRKKKRLLPVALPPADKGILMSPSYRSRDDYRPKAVKFADGVLPGEGTSPSGGEEIHSPPPPTPTTTTTATTTTATRKKEKKFRKKRKVKVKLIKLYTGDKDGSHSPPPPPGSPPPFTALKLYPGYTHYTFTAPSTAVIYTQPSPQQYAYNQVAAIPGGVVVANRGGATTPTNPPTGMFSYPGYVYTTLYSPSPSPAQPTSLQYILPAATAAAAAGAGGGGGGGGGGARRKEE
ncbi:zinc finger CCCH domain-containing protein 13-like [Scylla paramamosain]|uniref:zinc finger CCCH domain-containing protein 13-like n=1 Tax=Scylla paramamosain TaxID=85552 RepID=UPI003083D6B3